MEKLEKHELLTARILTHVARYGFADVQRFAHLAKGMGIGRSLLYFYFKSSEEIIEALCEHFKHGLNEFDEQIRARRLNFYEYVVSLPEIKDLVFFAHECQKEALRNPALMAPILLVAETVDSYSFERFKVYYELTHYDPEQIAFLYGCLRSKWWESLGSYDEWGRREVEAFFSSVDSVTRTFKLGCSSPQVSD